MNPPKENISALIENLNTFLCCHTADDVHFFDFLGEGFFEFEFWLIIGEIQLGFSEVEGRMFGVVFGVEFGAVPVLEDDSEGFDFRGWERHLKL